MPLSLIEDNAMDYAARTPAQLGQILRNCRKRRDLSQAEAGSKVGLKQGTVSVIESGSAGVSVESLYKILSALGLELIVRDSTEKPTRAAPREW
jgi:HTH-type transcriptional regulator / antitoxin HipB